MVAEFNTWTSLFEATNSTDEAFKSTSPLQEFILKGEYELEYTKLGAFSTLSAYNQVESVLKLSDIDLGKQKSGAVRIKVAEGSELEFYVITENSNYFSDNLKDAYSGYVINTGLGGDQAIRLTMKSGDYFSIDTDEEHSGIFRLRIIIDGEIISVSDPDKINDESFLYLIYAGAERTQQDGQSADTEPSFEPDEEPTIDPDVVITPNPDPDPDTDDEKGRSFPTALVVLGVILIVIIFMSRRSRNPPSNSQNFTKSDSGGGVESGGGVDA